MEMEMGSSQQNSSKARRRLNHFDRIAEEYADRHRVQFHHFLNKKGTKFEHRTSLRKLIDVNKNLHESQIKCIELMGFGTLAKIQWDQLDKVMLRWLLDRYDPEYSRFNIESHCYFVGDKDVEGALGVPATSQNIILDTTCTEGLKKYENIFKVVDGRIDIATLSDKLKSCTSTDTEFKVMYLVLLFGTVLFPGYTQNLPVHFLNPLVVVDCITDLNWAGLIRNTLNDGIIRWKNKEGTYISGCLLFLQVFFLAIIRPENSRSVINLASERPFLAFLTKQRIRSLTTDMQANVPYWSAKASYFGFDEMSAPTNSMNKTKVRTVRPDVSGDGSIDEHEENIMDSSVSPDDCVHDENVRDSKVSLDDFVHDENVRGSNVLPDDWVHADLPSDQHRSLNKSDEVEDPHVKQQTQNVQGDFYLRTELSMLRARVSRIEKQTDYVCKDDELRNPQMTQQTLNAHDDFYRNQLSLLSARVSRIEKEADYVCDDFGSRSQISLLIARVNSSEKQVAQLMNIVDELVTRHVNRDRSRNRTNSQEESVDKIDCVLQKLQNLEARIPLIIRSTLGGISHQANIAPISSNVNIPDLDTVDDSMFKKKGEKSVVDDMSKKKKREKSSTSTKKRDKYVLHISDTEQPPIPKHKNVPLNPTSTEDSAIIEFLFDSNLDSSHWVVDFGGVGCSRRTLACLKPGIYLNADVIDCVAYMCTRKSIALIADHDRWCFPTIFARHCMRKDYADERIIDMLHYCTSPVESCGQIYLPINDLHSHWFLAIIDLDAGHVFVCDTSPGGLREYRRKILDDVIIRMEDLLKKWKPDKYKIRDIKDEFKFEYPEWVPIQPNGYDCGLYVCLMMMYELGVEQLRDEDASVFARQQIAVQLYRSEYNKFAWPR